jgi:cytochrome b
MVVALFIMVAATAVTGMANLAADEGTGPLAGMIAKVERPARVPGQRRPPLVMKQVHETVANITLALVILEPIQEVEIHGQKVGLVKRRSMMRIMARRMNAATVVA